MTEDPGPRQEGTSDAGAAAARGLWARFSDVLAAYSSIAHAVSDGDPVTVQIRSRLESLRREAEALERALLAERQIADQYDRPALTPVAPPVVVPARTEPPAPTADSSDMASATAGPTDTPETPAGSHEDPSREERRQDRLLRRRRRGVRHVVQLDIWDHDLAALVAAGELRREETDDADAVAEAVEDIFDRWVHAGRAVPPPGAAARPTARQAGATVAESPKPPHTATPETGSEPRARDERRSGRDRRRPADELSDTLKLIAGSPLDRRKGGDRRGETD